MGAADHRKERVRGMKDELTESEQEMINELHRAATELAFLFTECRKLARRNNELICENSALKWRLTTIEKAARGD